MPVYCGESISAAVNILLLSSLKRYRNVVELKFIKAGRVLTLYYYSLLVNSSTEASGLAHGSALSLYNNRKKRIKQTLKEKFQIINNLIFNLPVCLNIMKC